MSIDLGVNSGAYGVLRAKFFSFPYVVDGAVYEKYHCGCCYKLVLLSLLSYKLKGLVQEVVFQVE